MTHLTASLSRPDSVFVLNADATASTTLEPRGDEWRGAGTVVSVRDGSVPTEIALAVRRPRGELSRVAVRWSAASEPDELLLGDHWERGYGDLQWRSVQPERLLPWYFAAHRPTTGSTTCLGVKTAPAAMCAWTVDLAGVTLWLDFRNGGMPSIPGDREIAAATVVGVDSTPGESAFATLRRFCAKLCDAPRLPPRPVCGNNNWYYAYGHGFDQDQVRRDAALLADLAGDHANRPFCVIDAGWSPGGSCPGGPWVAGWPDRFPDMTTLATDIRAAGVRPGIWMRPTALTVVDDPARLRAGPQSQPEKALDLTLPENLASIRADVARVRSWGYDLIKHDFSTFDAFGKWGFEMNAELTDANWSWHDRSLTNAEVILNLYQAIRDGAGDATLIGCNTIGHLAAGLFEVQRTGDDTSGKQWERTRRMGVNTLAFRLPQNGRFFATDADCVAHTQVTPWAKDRQWLDLVARSGTPLFVSVDPTTVTPEVKSAMSSAMRVALSGGAGDVEPLDWLTTTCPSRWRIDGKSTEYDWLEAWGALPFKV